jgi:hypothetical protein
MKMIRSVLFSVTIFIAAATGLFAQPGGGQNDHCETADPFCTGTLYNFPASVNAGNGQSGPCYSCLLTTPNPAWYYMKVLTPGSIIISMHSEPARDIDFCCWGPFTSQNCCGLLACNKVVDCSYSPSSQEVCNIPNAQTGQYYMLVITNFSNQPCNIIFEQTGGTGTTDCSILPPAASNNSPICADQTLLLTAQSVANATYHWTGPDGFQSSQQNPTIPNAQPINAGTYYLTITVNGQTSSDSSSTVAYIYEPVANAGNDTSIANGVFTVLHGNCSAGSGSYTYHWEPAAKLVDPNVQDPQTVNLFATTIFTLTATDDSASCQASDPVTVNIIGGVLAVNATATPASICAGQVTQLQAIGSGGAGNYTYEWTGPGGFTSTLPNPVVQPASTSTYDVTVSDGYNTATGSIVVTVIPLPLANAGIDDTIPYGTYIYLNGNVTGGSGNYMYAWEPANLLQNPNVQYPQTANLTATTVYSLTVTDLATNCVSNNNANVSILVTGGPLNVNPTASPNWVCTGNVTQLFASAGGGDTLGYTYSWTSNPPGFTSSSANPVVNPVVNTTYSVTVNDGFNSVTGNTLVSIYPQPQIRLGPPDTTICIYDTVTLDAGNPGSEYLWSNGAGTRTVRVGSSGIGYDFQTYSVQVTSENGCVSDATINIVYSFEACMAIDEKGREYSITIFPNPTSGKVRFNLHGVTNETRVRITDLFGRTVFSTTLPKPDQHYTSEEVILPDLSKGIYMVRFSNEDLSLTLKLLVE